MVASVQAKTIHVGWESGTSAADLGINNVGDLFIKSVSNGSCQSLDFLIASLEKSLLVF